MDTCITIAEIGGNHKGSLEVAKEMIRTAKLFCGVDVVKFQKRTNKELLTPEEYAAPHPNPDNSYGITYGAHREFLEFSKDQHAELKKFCEEVGIIYSTSVWDLTAAKEITSLNPILIKIPSATNLRFDVVGYLADEYGGEIHISLGMTTKEEQKKIVDFLASKNRAKDTVLYACTSGYPVEPEDMALLEITRLREEYGDTVKSIGFSGHHLGTALDIAAYTLGASHIERHFTLNRAWKGTDHSASLEPDALRRLVLDLGAAYKALSYKAVEILPVEEVQRKKLKRTKS